MEQDQAARLRTLVRTTRQLAALDTGPPQLTIASLQGMTPQGEVERFVADLVAAVADQGVRLVADGSGGPTADWVYTLVTAPQERVDLSSQLRASVVVLLAEPTPSALLATYALIKQMHTQGAMPPIEAVFCGEQQISTRACEGLQGTSQRFLGWVQLRGSAWNPARGKQSLGQLVNQLTSQLPLLAVGENGAANSLAETGLEGV